MLGNTDIFGLRYSLLLSATEEYSHTFSVGADYVKSKQSIVVNGAGSISKPITYMPLSANYTGNWLGNEHPTTLNVTAIVGIRGLSGNTDSEFAANRFGASANFLMLRTGLQRTENLGKWALSGKLELQLASGPLLSNEQFTAGGAESVRGYLEAERAGDHALRASVELRTPQYKPAGETSLWGLTGLTFFDAARLRTLQPLFPQPANRQLRGVGVGLRLVAPRGIAVELDWAHALDDGDITKAGNNRLHARLVWGY